jgi:threonine/homoserine/homoserine lactone efflux protein
VIDPRFVGWLAVSAVLIMTPGPDTALTIRNTLRGGSRAAAFTGFGVGLGSLIWASASVLGLAFVLQRSQLAFGIFKLVGAAYLVYLGITGLIASLRRNSAAGSPASNRTPQPMSSADAFRQGLVNNLLNPKAGAIFATLMPQFLTPQDGPIRFGLMMLAYDLMVIGWLSLYGYLLGRAARGRLGARVSDALERVSGVVLVGLGVRLALEKR